MSTAIHRNTEYHDLFFCGQNRFEIPYYMADKVLELLEEARKNPVEYAVKYCPLCKKDPNSPIRAYCKDQRGNCFGVDRLFILLEKLESKEQELEKPKEEKSIPLPPAQTPTMKRILRKQKHIEDMNRILKEK